METTTATPAKVGETVDIVIIEGHLVDGKHVETARTIAVTVNALSAEHSTKWGTGTDEVGIAHAVTLDPVARAAANARMLARVRGL